MYANFDMTNPEAENKLKHILLEISKNKGDEESLIQVIEHSSFEFEKHWNNEVFPTAFNLEITISADVFTKNYSLIANYEKTIRHRINESSKLIIDRIKILPDYTKLEIINSKVFSVVTEWEEINQLQRKLITNLQTRFESIDIQNIGLVSRTIMDKLARQVFDLNKHKPKDPKIQVTNVKFKNQLHTYIDTILSGDTNKEFRKVAKSSIDFVEDSIDLMNTTTHKLDAERHLAEVCVISTISAISIIKLVKQLE